MAAARRQGAPSAPVELSAPAPGLYAEAYALAERAPLPAAFAAVRLGTAGWSDASLSRNELFYPKSVKTPEARLLDATYYALLSAETVRRGRNGRPPAFISTSKLTRFLPGTRSTESACRVSSLRRCLSPWRASGCTEPTCRPISRARIEQRYFASLAPLASHRGSARSLCGSGLFGRVSAS